MEEKGEYKGVLQGADDRLGEDENIKYLLSDENMSRLENNFTYHAPNLDQIPRYELIRAEAKKFALVLMKNCPSSRELSLALTDVENAVMWANASIARNE